MKSANLDLESRNIYTEDKAFLALRQMLDSQNPSKLFILCDEHTHRYCLPDFLAELSDLPPLEILEIEAGEESKDPAVLLQLWESLSELGADRHSLLINLGGGVVSDLGGFLAATYQRGIPFVNFPTSLLAMVDASVGGKTGINCGGFKNRVGSFSNPLMVGIVPYFLESLAPAEARSGWAEMLKHALLFDRQHWQELQSLDPEAPRPSCAQITRSVALKLAVVERDPQEAAWRKVLNFGHSLGHALESYSHQIGHGLSHGHAVALGMVGELELSEHYLALAPDFSAAARRFLSEAFPLPPWPLEREALLALVQGDKKNRGDEWRFSLLAAPGDPRPDIKVTPERVWKAFENLARG